MAQTQLSGGKKNNPEEGKEQDKKIWFPANTLQSGATQQAYTNQTTTWERNKLIEAVLFSVFCYSNLAFTLTYIADTNTISLSRM